jgi:hypothetical protein
MRIMADTEVGSSFPEEKGIGAKNGVKRPPAPDKNRGRTGKWTCKSMKQANNHINIHAGRGQQTIWKIPVNA